MYDRWRNLKNWRRVASVPLCLLAVTLSALACGGEEEDDSGGDPLSCTRNTSFVGRIHQNGAVVLQAAATPCGGLKLDVVFTAVSGIFTAGFDVTYPTAILAYESFTPGPLLNQGPPATPPFFIVTEQAPGRIVVFATRFNPDGDVDAVGDSVLLTLSFRATAIGEGPIVFDTASSPVQDQVLDDQNVLVLDSAGFLNGSNLARVF